MFFNKFVNKIVPYKVVSQKAWEVNVSSEFLKLDWNEATIPPSPKVAVALHNFIQEGRMNWYPNVDNKMLRNKIANYVNVSDDNVEYFASSDALHEYIIRAFINPGDLITMIAPTYDNFRAASESIGAVINYFELEGDNFSFFFEKFEAHLESVQPKIVYLCNPNNPTGTIYSVELIERLLNRFNDVLFIVDEAYFEFTKVSSAQLAAVRENIIVCRTFSKAFALASFRIGYAIASRHNMDGLRKIRNSKNISSFSQIAAMAALDDLDYTERYVVEVNETKKWFRAQIESFGFKVRGSESGNFILIDFGEVQGSIVDFLDMNNISVRKYGHVNGMGKFTRITIGTKTQMMSVIDCVKDFIGGK